MNVLFTDGHAQTMPSGEVTQQYHFAGAPMRNAENNMFNLHKP